MSSHVFYRFRSQKEPSRISFDGTGISVWDLKKDIIMENKMGRGADFDFAIYNADTEEEYHDHQVVPRSTSVLARRLPPARPGRGNAQDYMVSADSNGPSSGPSTGRGEARQVQRGGVQSGSGRGGWNAGSFSKRFDGRDESKSQQPAAGTSQEPIQVVLPTAAPADEASALAAMFAASSQQWQETQEQMANQTPIRRPPMMNNRLPPRRDASGSAHSPATATASAGVGDASTTTTGSTDRPASAYRHEKYEFSKPTPPGYICYRCGQKGHWIQECPTNNDHAYDNRPKIKRTTGIPKSFLEAVEGPIDPTTNEDLKSSGVMVTAEGGFVVARPDQASWLAHRAITKNLSASDVQNLAPTDPDLTCPIDSKLLKEAVLTPCCQTSFCRDCVENALSDNDMLCPECETRIKSFEKLRPDEARRERVKKYIEEVVEASKEEEPEIVEVKEELEEGATVKKENGEASEEVKKEEAGDEVKPKEEAKEATPFNAALSPSTTHSSDPTSHPNFNAQQQQQLLIQQIMHTRQQLSMSQMQLQQLQAQVFQLSQTAQNPRMAPMMRMQAQGQMQQVQMMSMALMQGIGQQQMMLQGLLVRAGMPMAHGQMGSGGGGGPIPTGPRAQMPNGPRATSNGPAVVGGGGVKREVPKEFEKEEGANGSEPKKIVKEEETIKVET